MLDGLVFSFKIPQRQLGDLEVFWGGIGRGLTKTGWYLCKQNVD